MANNYSVSMSRGLLALSPLAVFLVSYLVLSLIIGDFYKMPLSVAFIIASIWGVLSTPKMPLRRRIDIFSGGAANRDVIYMVWIFVLAGAFAVLAQRTGATQATVDLTLNLLPANYLMPGLFLAACFVSMSVGTSVGTVVALTPVAVGIADEIGQSVPMFAAIVVGGAFFGDNLSFISDTTITATRSQGCEMRDKFKTNIWLALPAALIIFVVYVFMGENVSTEVAHTDSNWILVVPYCVVILTALLGLNVLVVLILGIVCSLVLGLALTDNGIVDMFGFMGAGVESVGNLIVVTLLASGLLGLIKHNGGILFVIERLSSHIRGKRGAQAVISVLVGIVNVCTANNTIAIITVGGLSKEISDKYGLDNRKTASLLDTCSCVVQSILPYGAQVLMAASLAGVSPLLIVPNLYYPFALGAMVALSIVFQFPRRHS
ncbi:MAG: Na+/H+ antiporter NhaC family protein [Bacteroidales bacterium]|nr:Na+/H+ antiporter NhaC family protein [Bacteroidales bacterium]